jgi:hypothetical protein
MNAARSEKFRALTMELVEELILSMSYVEAVSGHCMASGSDAARHHITVNEQLQKLTELRRLLPAVPGNTPQDRKLIVTLSQRGKRYTARGGKQSFTCTSYQRAVLEVAARHFGVCDEDRFDLLSSDTHDWRTYVVILRPEGGAE